MPHSSRPLPSTLPPGFTSAHAHRAGVTSRRLSQNDITRVAFGLYVRADAGARGLSEEHPASKWRRDQRSRALALGPSLNQSLFFSHRTAAVLWNLPLPGFDGSELEVSCFTPARAPRRTGLRSSKVQPWLARTVTLHGVQVSDPPSTWAMLARHLELPDLVALGDAVIHEPRIPGTLRSPRPALASLEDLTCTTALRRPGIERLRAALPLLSAQSASAPESHLRLLIRSWNLPEPTLDYDVYDERGGFLGCSEIAYPKFRLAIEYEGSHHLISRTQWNRDIAKYRAYTAAGWETLRVTAELQYRDTAELRRQITTALLRRGWRQE